MPPLKVIQYIHKHIFLIIKNKFTLLINEIKNTLMQEYSSSKSDMKDLYQIRKNYEKYMGKEIER